MLSAFEDGLNGVFTFQEPENDPRHYCYLWSVSSETDYDSLSERFSVEQPAVLTLNSLSYESKDDHEEYGVLYSTLRGCEPRFRHQLGTEQLQVREQTGPTPNVGWLNQTNPKFA